MEYNSVSLRGHTWWCHVNDEGRDPLIPGRDLESCLVGPFPRYDLCTNTLENSPREIMGASLYPQVTFQCRQNPVLSSSQLVGEDDVPTLLFSSSLLLAISIPCELSPYT